MGLTIHFDLKTDLTNSQDVRHLLESVRQHAFDLPFKEVGEVKEFTGRQTAWNDKDDPDRWLKIQSAGHVSEGNSHFTIPAQHIIALSTWPGEGCEPANFGFCKYPPYFKAGKRRIATKLEDWRWHSFCKTQYSSDPNCGGVENFLRCHLSVVKVLDFIKRTGLATAEVSDEGGFWENRNLEALAKEVGEWNEFVAVSVNAFRSGGLFSDSPITKFPNLEHLEAKGASRVAELRRKLGLPEE